MTSPVGPLCEFEDVIIESGSSLSGAVNLLGRIPAGVIMPSAWTAASLTFQVSDQSDGTFVDVYDTTGTEMTLTVGANQFVYFNSLDFLGFRFMKVRSGTSAAAVNQGAERILRFATGIPTTSQ